MSKDPTEAEEAAAGSSAVDVQWRCVKVRIPSPPAVALMMILAAPTAAAATTPTLRGSPGSMTLQNEIAQRNDYTFLRSADEVQRFAEEGWLVPVQGNEDYALGRVSYPYARPELRTFIERLAAQYRAGCGERLVVTSLTRPLAEQPSNSHPLSVHPAGMAVDLRVSQRAACRRWLEGALLGLEARGLLDVTREYRPPHYHVAVFPDAYGAYAAERIAEEQVEQARQDSVAAAREARVAAARRRVEARRAAVAAATPRTRTGAIPVLIAALLVLAPWGGRAVRRRFGSGAAAE